MVGGCHLFNAYYLFYSLYFFCAICGISTSGVIEDTVVGSPCCVIYINVDSSVFILKIL